MTIGVAGVVKALRGKRVVPTVPEGFSVGVDMREADVPIRVARDGSSGWSVFVRYVNAKKEVSRRRLTCRKLVGYGTPEGVYAFCHETGAVKQFRIDCIKELVDLATGEVVDPVRHFGDLHVRGLLRMRDKALDDLASVLVFLARCDGEYHPLEQDALTDALSRYCLRFGGDDLDIEKMLKRIDSIAPDAGDMIGRLNNLCGLPKGPELARLILDSTGRIVHADGRISEDEMEWSSFLQLQLRAVAARR